MTVSTTTSRVSYTGDGATTVFNFSFKILQTGDMDVQIDGVLLSTGVTVAIAASGVGGTVTITPAPAAGTSVLLIRNVDLTQETSLAVEGDLPELTLENAYDKLTMLAQQLDEKLNRALSLLTASSKSGAFNNEPTASLVLPVWNNDNGYFEFTSVATAFNEASPASGGGNVTGPGASTNYSIPMWNGTTGLTLRAGSALGVAGTIFTSNGIGSAPTWQSPAVDARVGGRLTLTSGLPVTTADVTAAGTIYYTPYKSRTTWLRYAAGSNVWKPYSLSELSLALVVTSGTPYDIFIEATSESAAQLVAVAWTNTTTRATALAYDATSGFLVKSDSTSKVYLGTIYATNTNQTEDSAARRMVWNYHNRVRRSLFASDSTNTWSYATATFRAANANTTPGAGRVDFVIGVAEDAVRSTYTSQWANNGTGDAPELGIALDSTTVPFASIVVTTSNSFVMTGSVGYIGIPAAGYHYLQSLEKGGSFGDTFRGDNGGTVPLSYQAGEILS